MVKITYKAFTMYSTDKVEIRNEVRDIRVSVCFGIPQQHHGDLAQGIAVTDPKAVHIIDKMYRLKDIHSEIDSAKRRIKELEAQIDSLHREEGQLTSVVYVLGEYDDDWCPIPLRKDTENIKNMLVPLAIYKEIVENVEGFMEQRWIDVNGDYHVQKSKLNKKEYDEIESMYLDAQWSE